jgi:hypothetical protein
MEPLDQVLGNGLRFCDLTLRVIARRLLAKPNVGDINLGFQIQILTTNRPDARGSSVPA